MTGYAVAVQLGQRQGHRHPGESRDPVLTRTKSHHARDDNRRRFVLSAIPNTVTIYQQLKPTTHHPVINFHEK